MLSLCQIKRSESRGSSASEQNLSTSLLTEEFWAYNLEPDLLFFSCTEIPPLEFAGLDFEELYTKIVSKSFIVG